jgi:hypothetical protein
MQVTAGICIHNIMYYFNVCTDLLSNRDTFGNDHKFRSQEERCTGQHRYLDT